MSAVSQNPEKAVREGRRSIVRKKEKVEKFFGGIQCFYRKKLFLLFQGFVIYLKVIMYQDLFTLKGEQKPNRF